MSGRFDAEAEFQIAFTRELGQLAQSEGNAFLSVRPLEVFCLMMAVQAAVRQPDAAQNQGLQIARGVVEKLSLQFAHSPALSEMVRRGWLKEYDR